MAAIYATAKAPSMTENSDLKIGGLLLAAGGSSRLGQPKQLLLFEGKTLIRRAAETLVNSACEPVVVILGAEIERSAAEISDLNVNVQINKDWGSGMSSSINSGVRSLLETEPGLDAVVIALCDQPNIRSADIDQLIRVFNSTGRLIVASQYGDAIGVPALFCKAIFIELLALTGDKGARRIIQGHITDVETVEMDNAAFDIDTVDDADRLISR